MIWFIIGIFVLFLGTELIMKWLLNPLLKIIEENSVTNRYSDGVILSFIGAAAVVVGAFMTGLSYLILALHGWVL